MIIFGALTDGDLGRIVGAAGHSGDFPPALRPVSPANRSPATNARIAVAQAEEFVKDAAQQ